MTNVYDIIKAQKFMGQPSPTPPTPTPQGTEWVVQDTFSVYTLKKVTIPEGVEAIGDHALEQFYSLETVILPSTLTTIGETAFGECGSLTSITLPDSVTRIKQIAFAGSGLTSITLPPLLTEIELGVFSQCPLVSVDIPAGVTSIGVIAFDYCTRLMSITCRATTPPTVGENAFRNVPNNCAIYVPAASVDTYKAASGWSDRAAYIQAL